LHKHDSQIAASCAHQNQTRKRFVYEHASLFELPTGGEFGHGHYDIWLQFRRIAEAQIDSLLSEIGGSMSQLEKQIDRRLQQAPRGPRDAEEIDALSDMMMFESFESFAAMMVEANREVELLAHPASKPTSRAGPTLHEELPSAGDGEDDESEESLEAKSTSSERRALLRPTGTTGGLRAQEAVLSELEAMGFSADAAAVALYEVGPSHRGSLVEAAVRWLVDAQGHERRRGVILALFL
jgi:hypothetical protein